MGQKINPHGLRVGVIKDWDSRWFESDEKFGDTLGRTQMGASVPVTRDITRTAIPPPATANP